MDQIQIDAAIAALTQLKTAKRTPADVAADICRMLSDPVTKKALSDELDRLHGFRQFDAVELAKISHRCLYHGYHSARRYDATCTPTIAIVPVAQPFPKEDMREIMTAESLKDEPKTRNLKHWSDAEREALTEAIKDDFGFYAEVTDGVVGRLAKKLKRSEDSVRAEWNRYLKPWQRCRVLPKDEQEWLSEQGGHRVTQAMRGVDVPNAKAIRELFAQHGPKKFKF